MAPFAALQRDESGQDLTVGLRLEWVLDYLYEFCVHRKAFGSNGEDPRSACLGDFLLRPAERFRYRYNFLVFWESDLRLEATVPLHGDFAYPRCVGGRHPAPDEDDGGAWEYQRLQDDYKLPPLEALAVLAETTQSVFRNGGRAGIDFEELEEATHRVEEELQKRTPLRRLFAAGHRFRGVIVDLAVPSQASVCADRSIPSPASGPPSNANRPREHLSRNRSSPYCLDTQHGCGEAVDYRNTFER